MKRVLTGLERFCQTPPDWTKGRRLGLLCNAASVRADFVHASKLIARTFPHKLRALFTPQHGFHAEKQDNMIESAGGMDPDLKIPIFSLYSKPRIPTEEMFDDFDTLLVDLQDVGTRVYTFVDTRSYCMEVAGKTGKKVVVLDRPNPVNGIAVEGNCLKDEWISFVGRYAIPMRHGLTIGELARLFNRNFGIECDLEVVPMKRWKRWMFFGDTGLPWIPPSPNLPTPTSALVYPGQVIFEGTNLSEGRGTTQPFELFGAPFVDCHRVLSDLHLSGQTGFHLRDTLFEPTSNKWAGTPCRGFQIHVTDPGRYRPYRTSLTLLQATLRHHRERFQWKSPPYEYETERLPIDLIIGDKSVREHLEQLVPVEKIAASWQEEKETFRTRSREVYLY